MSKISLSQLMLKMVKHLLSFSFLSNCCVTFKMAHGSHIMNMLSKQYVHAGAKASQSYVFCLLVYIYI